MLFIPLVCACIYMGEDDAMFVYGEMKQVVCWLNYRSYRADMLNVLFVCSFI